MIKELQKLSFVRRIYASDSNFVLFEVGSSRTFQGDLMVYNIGVNFDSSVRVIRFRTR